MTPKRALLAGLVLLAFQTVELTYALKSDGMAYDELLYIASGYRQWTTGDHRFGAEHPPLARLVSALPLRSLDLTLRPLTADDAAAGWGWAYQFVHVDNASKPLLARSRLSVVALSLLLSVVLWRWCREACGEVAGIAALALSTFHPSLLAHGHLVTTDIAGALTLTLTSWAMWRWCAAPRWSRALLVGLALGVAFATRLTALLLIPVIALLAVDWWRRNKAQPDRHRAVLILASACVVLVPLTIWAAYGFRYEAWPGEAMPRIVPSVWLTAIQGTAASRVLDLLKSIHALPAAYLASIEVYLIKSTLGHQAYLLGQVSASGWWYYYAVAFLAKNTPGFLLAVVITALAWRRIPAGALKHFAGPALLMFVAASASRVQVGERYILPVYVYLILLIASATPLIFRERQGAILAAVVLGLHAGPSLMSARDGYLGYFNFLVGRDQAPMVLADSNLDWGQDLPRLAAWQRAHPQTPLQLAYWGMDDPDRYGIVREDLPGSGLYPMHPPKRPFTGVVAISSTYVSGLYPPPGMEGIYRQFLKRTPDDRAGVFMIYKLAP